MRPVTVAAPAVWRGDAGATAQDAERPGPGLASDDTPAGPRPGEPDARSRGQPQQIHLDLWVDDFPAADAEVRALGAVVLKEAETSDTHDAFQVYADPAGHPFCLCWVR